MDSPMVDAGVNTRRPTAIPRLNKKSSFESALRCSNVQTPDENPLNRCASDPNQHTNRSDKGKKLGKFTINDSKKDDGDTAGNSETDDEINSIIFNGKAEEKMAEHDVKREDGDIAGKNRTIIKNINSHRSSNGTITPGYTESACQTVVPPLQIPTLQSDDEHTLRTRLSSRVSLNTRQTQKSPNNSLKEAYLRQLESRNPRINRTFDQCTWNAINPLYKNLALSEGIVEGCKFNTNLINDTSIEAPVLKEESSDIDSDDETIFKSNSTKPEPEANAGLYKLYKMLAKNKEDEAILKQSYENKRETLVNAFLEVFGNDSHIIQKLRNNTLIKNEDLLKKLQGDSQVKISSQNRGISTIPEFVPSKFIQDIYKNDDVFSTVTQSTNDIWSCHSSPKRRPASKASRPKSNVSLRSCGCEIKHLQLNEVQKSITDIHKGMKFMLANLSPTSNEELALELAKLRVLYTETLSYHKKLLLQNRKLQTDMHKLCQSVNKMMEGRKSGGFILKLLMLPILGAITYFVVTHFDLCKKFPVICEE